MEYLDAYLCTYIDLEYGGNPDLHIQPKHIYGWIKNVELIATKGTEICRISWDVDHWRTYAWIASFGSGHVLRQPSQQSVNRTWCQGLVQNAIYGSSQSLIDSITADTTYYPAGQTEVLTDPWAIVQFIEAGTTTRVSSLIFPIGGAIRDESGPTNYQGPNELQIFRGYLDELLGQTNPENILGAWVIPCCPAPQAFQRVAYQGSYFWEIRSNIYGAVVPLTPVTGSGMDDNPAAFKLRVEANISLPDIITASMPANPSGASYLKDTITDTVNVTDSAGRIVWTLPPNIQIKNTFSIGWEINTVSAYCLLHFERSDDTTHSYSEAMADGLICIIPLVSLPVSSNSWQSYNVTGQREYDIESAKAANNAAYKKGLANTGSQALEGAIGGALVGGGPAAAAGAAIGAVFNVISSSIGKTIDEELRQKVQTLKDTAVANQAQHMITPGEGFYWTQSGGYRILIMHAIDNGECAADIAENGYHADMAISSWNKTTGPWQIENLDVTGTIPTEARIQLRNMLQAGIYIDITG